MDKKTYLPYLKSITLREHSGLLTKLRDYRVFTVESLSDSFDDTYENLKYINFLYNKNYNQIVNIDTNQITPTSYTQILDSFRADIDDIS